jgi:type II secretory pathway predicted ATPase ExeA
MYESHWNLARKPFRNDLDLSFAFMWEGYEEAVARMQYWAADGKRLAIITGPPGVGKSYLLAMLSRDIRRRGDIVTTVPNPSLSADEFLQYILTLYGFDETEPTKSEALAALTQFGEENTAQGIRTYLLIDEAQAIACRETLEEINLILNLAEGARPFFSVALAGEGGLRNSLADCAGLRQKVEIGAELSGLSLEDTARYLAHRLKLAGAKGQLFESRAIGKLHTWSQGLPRLINIGADLALLAAFGEGKAVVDLAALESGLEEVESHTANS